MAYWLRKDMRPVELAREAFAAAGLKPYDHVIRGGTDGSALPSLAFPPPTCSVASTMRMVRWNGLQCRT